LAENVNRLEMHPLDEAVAFRKLLDSGVAVTEVASRYERSVSGIYQRARLTHLVDEIKDWFRGGKITLSMAAALSSLNEEQQRQFFQDRKKSSSISRYHINDFFYKIQHCRLEAWFMDKKCEHCKTRTYHTDPQLFEDYKAYQDVCFDAPCWNKHVEMFFLERFQVVRDQYPDETFKHLLLIDGYSAPDFFDEEESLVIAGISYDVRRKWDFQEVTNAGIVGTFRAFCIFFSNSEPQINSGIFVERTDESEQARGIPIEDYLDESHQSQVSEEVKAALNEKYSREWDFREELKDRILEKYLKQAGESGKDPSLAVIDQWFAGRGNRDLKKLKRLFLLYTSKKFSGYSKAFKEFSAAKVFFTLCALTIVDEIPLKGATDAPEEISSNPFLKFSGLNGEEYVALYESALNELMAEAGQGASGET
jgi:hypothetical protein